MSQGNDTKPLKSEQTKVLHWQTVAQSLGKSDAYLARIQELLTEVSQGIPLSKTAQVSMQADIQTHEQLVNDLRGWYAKAKAIGRDSAYLERIQQIAETYKTGTPLTKKAVAAMHEDSK